VARNRLLLVFAHPDDESFTAGGTIAKYAHQGVDIHLLVATKGEAGKTADYCKIEELGAFRERETLDAAKVLGINNVNFLGYRDKELSKADPLEVSLKIAGYIRKVRPQVVITFGPDGSSGHQDHKAIHYYTIAALGLAKNPDIEGLGDQPFEVSRLYYAGFPSKVRLALGRTEFLGPEPNFSIDTTAFVDTKLAAMQCHRTQSGSLNKFKSMGEDKLAYFMKQEYFRLAEEYSSESRSGGTDLFAEKNAAK
jgi:N-acetylglucosamine malate deacetylase 2